MNTTTLIITAWIESLRQQHQIDMELYQMAHQNKWNQYLHCVFVPVETFTFFVLLHHLLSFLCVDQFITKISLYMIYFTMILMTWIVAPWTLVGYGTILYTIGLGYYTIRPIMISYPKQQQQSSWRILFVLWILSWMIQIGIGHMWLEQNSPNLWNTSVSTLAMTQSVLMAWKTCF